MFRPGAKIYFSKKSILGLGVLLMKPSASVVGVLWHFPLDSQQSQTTDDWQTIKVTSQTLGISYVSV